MSSFVFTSVFVFYMLDCLPYNGRLGVVVIILFSVLVAAESFRLPLFLLECERKAVVFFLHLKSIHQCWPCSCGFLLILIALDIVYFSITLKHDNNKSWCPVHSSFIFLARLHSTKNAKTEVFTDWQFQTQHKYC